MFNFFPDNAKATKAETIGQTYVWLRRLGILAVIVSGGLFSWVNYHLGFYVLLVGYLVVNLLDGRKHYIEESHLMDKNHEMRMRLIGLGDQEFVLESMQADRIWYGMPEKPEITAHLKAIKEEKLRIKEGLEKAIRGFVDQLTPKTTDTTDKN